MPFIFISPLFHLFHLRYYLSSTFLFWDDTKWPTKVDVSLNPNTISQSRHHWEHSRTITYKVLKILYLSVLNDDSMVVHQMYIFWAYSFIYIIITDIIVKTINRFERAWPFLRKSSLFHSVVWSMFPALPPLRPPPPPPAIFPQPWY